MTHKPLESGSQSRRVLRGEIVTLGDELNRGEIIDSNAASMADKLTQLGIHVRFRQGANDHITAEIWARSGLRPVARMS